jgi:hypothetical protein
VKFYGIRLWERELVGSSLSRPSFYLQLWINGSIYTTVMASSKYIILKYPYLQ